MFEEADAVQFLGLLVVLLVTAVACVLFHLQTLSSRLRRDIIT